VSPHTIRVNDVQSLSFSSDLPRRIESVVRATLREGAADGPDPSRAEISVTLVDSPRMRELNSRFHAVDAPTDVLAFDLGSPDEDAGALLGDVYVCAAVADEFAREHEEDSEVEILRLAIHGVLHLLGYDHPDGAERYDSEMFTIQERLLAAS
jgi:probable rRNA maturation factor